MQKAIYSIKDSTNKRVYVGEELDSNTHINKRLQAEYNSEDFKFCIELLLDESINLNNAEEKMLLLLLERKTINKYKEDGYEVFNAEDSLQRVLQLDKKLFSDDTKEYTQEEMLELFNKVNSKLKSFKQIDCLLYTERFKLKDLYSKKELIKAEILEEDGWNLYDTSIYYKLKYGFTKGVLSGDNYYKKIIFLLAYNIAIYII